MDVNVLQFSMAGLSISASFSISVWLHLFRLVGLSGQMKCGKLRHLILSPSFTLIVDVDLLIIALNQLCCSVVEVDVILT